MESSKYQETQNTLLALRHEFIDLDLEGLLDQIARSHAIVPVVDPTLYMRGADTLRRIERLATAALRFKAAVKEFDKR